MNAGIAFISRKSRKTDVAWRYAIAVAVSYTHLTLPTILLV